MKTRILEVLRVNEISELELKSLIGIESNEVIEEIEMYSRSGEMYISFNTIEKR